jgi:hypothetical protein
MLCLYNSVSPRSSWNLAPPPRLRSLLQSHLTFWTALKRLCKLRTHLAGLPYSAALVRTARAARAAQAVQAIQLMLRLVTAWTYRLLLPLVAVAAVQMTTATSGAVGRR